MTSPRRALITGITGQDGSYLAEFLLDQGYEVVGLVRRSSTVTFERIAPFQSRLTLVPGDLLDQSSLITAVAEHRPTEVYNCLLYTSPSPRDRQKSRMPSSA